MKKEVNKIIIFIGFIVASIGFIINAFTNRNLGVSAISSLMLTAVLATFFVFAQNNTVKNIGYGLCVICGGSALYNIVYSRLFFADLLFYIGNTILLLGAFIVFVTILLSLFGFSKGKSNNNNDVLAILNSYNSLKSEKIITEEEFLSLKQQTLEKSSNKNLSYADLRQWKKLLDQKIITDEEFSSIKSDLFKR